MLAEGGAQATAADSQDSQARLTVALVDRYAVGRELGRGGMATVYLAHDVRHDRPVALKVLHPELASALGPERFQREVRLAARLQHPHVLTVHDSGESAGRLWFTMPYVEGESLRDRLNRERQLPVDEAVRITREAAQGLEYAHRHGVVHRDVKPENLLLTEDGTTLVADFGIARSLTPGGERLTAAGVAVGTAAYMSPEQAAGERDVDGRSDVYALGCVLYEMLAGVPPFHAATAEAMIARRFSEAPHPVRQLRASVPEGVEQALQTALARTPADRFATAAEFARALATAPAATAGGATKAVSSARPGTPRRVAVALARRPLFTVLALGFVLGLGALFASRWGADRPAAAAAAAPAVDAPPAVAVLPFENLGDSGDAYFADGLTDAVRGKLTELAGLRVIARGSSAPYRGTAKPPTAIARELGVRYLLTGTVRWAKRPGGTSRVQVSPELVEVGGDGTAASTWQQPFDAPLTDVFKVQGEIAGRVAGAMRVALPGAARLAAAPTTNPAAYDAYLRGEAAWDASANGAPSAVRRALARYEQAVALDSAFALAWARLGQTAVLLYANGTPTPELARRAKVAAERAVALDPDGVEAHRGLASYYRYIERNTDRALAEVEAAYRRAPGDAVAVATLGLMLRVKGRWEEALRHQLAAYALDPRTAEGASQVATTYEGLRRPAEARPMADRALALAPGDVRYVARRASIALSEGDLAGARQVLRAATEAPTEEVVAYVATSYASSIWLLDDAGQRLALSLGPEAFDGDRGRWGLVRARIHAWRGDSAARRAWADTAERHFATQLRATPNDAGRHGLRGVALAYLGRHAEAVAAGERGLALEPVSDDGIHGPQRLNQLVRTYLLAGQHEKALEGLEALMRVPYPLTPARLRIDPAFAPLRGHPRFERLAAGG